MTAHPARPDLVRTEILGRVAVLTIDNPPLNAQSRAVRRALMTAIAVAEADPAVHALVLTGAGAAFGAGADLGELVARELEDPSPRDLHRVVEGCSKPVIAALHGLVLGGALELALACHWRIATDTARVGLPEVSLGLLPGGGGTQRLPRLVGVARALDMMLSGKPVAAETARSWGLLDALVAGDLIAAALDFAALGLAPLRVSERTIDPQSLPEGGLAAVGTAQAGGRDLALAPAQILDCVAAALSGPFEAGLDAEGVAFRRCLASPVADARLHLFFAERAAARLPGLAARPRPVQSVGVVGAGTMGSGIATAFALAGMTVTVVEENSAALDRGLAMARRNIEALTARGRLSPERTQDRIAAISGSLDLAALASADLIVEAVFESLAVKQAVLARLGEIARPGAILATNTSTLDVDVLAEASGRPADVVGLHFFSPAHIMRLLEIVRGARTAPDVLATALALARPLAKTPVVSGVCYGFIGNRMLEGYLREADALVVEGVAPEAIDRALEGFGMAMGPCRMMDMAGIDLGARLLTEASAAGHVPADPSYRAMTPALVAAGRLGAKNGLGFYRHEGRRAVPDPVVTDIAAETAARLGIARGLAPADDEIVLRCLLPLVNEAARLLEEGIATRASDVDVVWTAGYGFPADRGGPLHWADTVGAAALVARMDDFATRLGNAHGGWTVAPLLKRLAETDGRFAALPATNRPEPAHA